MKDKEIKTVITEFTMESGVRNLERSIGSICRIVAYRYAIHENPDSFEKIEVDNSIIEEALGNKKIDSALNERISRPGIAIGLAYTATGGRCLLIETTKFPGYGNITLTGQLGDVMKESVSTALSWVKANAIRLNLVPHTSKDPLKVISKGQDEDPRQVQVRKLMKQFDLHVHFPAAAIPKDGPSAGVTITVALVSLFSGCKVKQGYAMTGEISLQGQILPVGGIKEKVMAAHRNNITNILLPKKNEQDFEDVPEDVRREITVKFIEDVT